MKRRIKITDEANQAYNNSLKSYPVKKNADEKKENQSYVVPWEMKDKRQKNMML